MTLGAAVLAAALSFAAAPGGTRVAVVVHTAGFADDDARHVQDKVDAEINGTGAELWALSKALSVKTECLTDHACAKEVLRTADATWLVWVEALRAGGQVQLEAHLVNTDGRSIAQDESAARADDVLGGGSVVPAAVIKALKGAIDKAKPPTAATSTSTSTTAPPHPTTGTAKGDPGMKPLQPEAPPADPPPVALTPMAVGGIAALGGGALLCLGGGAVAASQVGIIRDPDSLGPAKEGAANVATAMLLVAGVGVALAGTGGVLLYMGM